MREQQQQPDRRAHIRAPLSVPVLLDSSSTRGEGRAADVSSAGLLVELAEMFQVGAELDVYFELPNRTAIDARGRVLRSDGRFVALAFTSIDATSQLALRSYCRLAVIRNRPGAPRAFGVTQPTRV